MAKTVFYSWQSDLDAQVTRYLIRDALKLAIKQLATELEQEERPDLDQDTKDVSGSPNIVETIHRKINEAAVFVADVTPIAESDSGKSCANPNVLLELGYAERALGLKRIIKVWNTAFPGAEGNRLPFDLRMQRWPIAFELQAGASKDQVKDACVELAKRLTGALKAALENLPSEPERELPWQPGFNEDHPNIWFDPNKSIVINSSTFDSKELIWAPESIGYVRIIPSSWQSIPSEIEKMKRSEYVPAILSTYHFIHCGISKGGVAAYWKQSNESHAAVTQWFEKSGEFWGATDTFLFVENGERTALAVSYLYKSLVNFLRINCELALKLGGKLPIFVHFGINCLRDSYWPRERLQIISNDYAAVQDEVRYGGKITEDTDKEIQQMAVSIFNEVASVYSQGPFTREQVMALTRR